MENKVKTNSFRNHLEQQYGKRGTEKRERYEKEFENFKLKALKGNYFE